MTHATDDAALAPAPTPVGVRHHCVWCGVAVGPVRHAQRPHPIHRLRGWVARRVANNYRLTQLRREWLPETENQPEPGYVGWIAREASRRLMAIQVVAFPIILVLTGVGGVVVGLVYDDGALAHCLRENYVTVFTGAARACAHHAKRLTEFPIYLDLPSALGAASALGTWILHRRLTFLMAHVPAPQKGWREPDDGSLAPAIVGRFGRGWHRNALSDPDRKRFFLFQEEWALRKPFRLDDSWLRRHSLLVGVLFAVALFGCYFFFGAPFRNACHGVSSNHCGFRASWWANPIRQPELAAGWILTVAIAATFGLDNFMTTSEFQHRVAETLTPPNGELGSAARTDTRTARLTEHFPDLPSSWTFLQAFLAEVRLGSIVGLASLTTILAMFFLGATGTEASLEYAVSIVVVGAAGAALLARRRRFESTLTTAANQILASEVDKVLRLREEAGDDEEKEKEANARMEWLIAHGSLPPIKLEVRLRTYIYWAVVAAGLFLTLYQSVR